MGPFKISRSLVEMKLGYLLLVAMAAGEKKVPPNTPEGRIEQLKKHMARLETDFLSGCRHSHTWTKKMHGVADRALRAYEKDCKFFDPAVPHGGPEPEGYGPDWKPPTTTTTTTTASSTTIITTTNTCEPFLEHIPCTIHS